METANQPSPPPQPQPQLPAAVQQAQKSGTGAPGPPPQPATAPSLGPNLHQHDRTLRVWRLRVRIGTAVFVALAIILIIAQGTTGNSRSSCRYYHGNRYCRNYGSPANNLISLPILVVAMVWNIAEFITYCVNKRGAHPGVHVALDLVIFLALLLGGIIAVAVFVGPVNSSLGIAAGSLELVASAAHFALFVMACVATHRRRMLMKSYLRQIETRLVAGPQIVYAYPPPPQGMAPYHAAGHYGPQYHELEQRVPPAQSATSGPSAVSPAASSPVPSVQPAAPYSNVERYA